MNAENKIKSLEAEIAALKAAKRSLLEHSKLNRELILKRSAENSELRAENILLKTQNDVKYQELKQKCANLSQRLNIALNTIVAFKNEVANFINKQNQL
jgi:hypothetical protein